MATATATAGPIPLVNNVVTDEDFENLRADGKNSGKLVPVSVFKTHKLLTDKHSKQLVDRHVRAIYRLAKYFSHGFLMKDADLVCDMIKICRERLHSNPQYEKPLCDLIKVCKCPFLKERASDESTFDYLIVNLLTELGHTMKVQNVAVQLKLAESLIQFYADQPMERQLFEGLQASTSSYSRSLVEKSGVAQALVESLELVEDLSVRLEILKVLQCYSLSVINCQDMLSASAASLLCSGMNIPDPSDRIVFRTVEILWNLLECDGAKQELANQLNCKECISALRDTFIRKTKEGFSHADRQLRNDLLVISSLVLSLCPTSPFMESGFTKLIAILATFTEVKSHHGLARNLKLYKNHEDFEFKKLLMNILVLISADSASCRILSEGRVILALFSFVRTNDNVTSTEEWSPAQFEELQLQALDTLSAVGPQCVDDYMTCQGNTRLLMLLEWCVGQADYGGHGNSFHGSGGRGNKRAQMRYCLRLLRSMVSVGDEVLNQDLVDQGAINQIVGILQNASTSTDENDRIDIEMQCDMLFIVSSLCDGDTHRKELFGGQGVQVLAEYLRRNPDQITSPLGHHQLLLAAVDCVWSAVLGCYLTEQLFLESDGVFHLLDLLEICPLTMQNLLLGCLTDLCENTKALAHLQSWRGKNQISAAKLLVELWKKEEANMGVVRDVTGKICDLNRPLMGAIQERQGVIPLPANRPSQAIVDVSENMRAKIYSMFCKLGFNAVPGLSTLDYITVAVIEKYLDFKMLEVWNEIRVELEQQNIRPVSPDADAITEITKRLNDSAIAVAETQNQLSQAQCNQDLIEEEEYYESVKENHRQEEKALKDFSDYVNRTSDYTVLKAVKRKQLSAIQSSRLRDKTHAGSLAHETLQGDLSTTTFCGRRVEIESTPLELTRSFMNPTSSEENKKTQLVVT
ncbi:cilia- and flagella-associated protein 69-like [Acropora millepora]|uniref:cilia- and flagella-associated protein 69-like n=1 Tax=Acropora millepora TaxID=45264 RepID=UPI001CF2648B|nr:cilia- and flagella-associated protein 69-like [Acropora millepora]